MDDDDADVRRSPTVIDLNGASPIHQQNASKRCWSWPETGESNSEFDSIPDHFSEMNIDRLDDVEFRPAHQVDAPSGSYRVLDWHYENLTFPTPSIDTMVPDLLEVSRCYATQIDRSTIDQQQSIADAKTTDAGCSCGAGTASETPTDNQTPTEQAVKDGLGFGFVDRARAISFKRKKSSDPACRHCTCFLDPVELVADNRRPAPVSSSLYGYVNSIDQIAPVDSISRITGSYRPSQPAPSPPLQHRQQSIRNQNDYQNCSTLAVNVLPSNAGPITVADHPHQDLMLSMDSPPFPVRSGESRKNKLNLSIDTGCGLSASSQASVRSCNKSATFYDPICDFLITSPVIKKLTELGFVYPSISASDFCSKENKRLKVSYAVIAALLLIIVVLLFVYFFVPQAIGLESQSKLSGNQSHSSSLDGTIRTSTAGSLLLSTLSSDEPNPTTESTRSETTSTTTGTLLMDILGMTARDGNVHSTTTPGFPTPPDMTNLHSTTDVEPVQNVSLELSAATADNVSVTNDVATTATTVSDVFSIANVSFASETTTTINVPSTTTVVAALTTTTASPNTTTSTWLPLTYPADIQCPYDQFKCRAGVSRLPCLNSWERCDGIMDCSDGSDEQACDVVKCFGNFQCADKSCVALAKACNGIFDCPDGSDERNCDKFKCQSYEYRCSSGYCIPNQWVCDGEADCSDHIEEYNCSTSCPSNQFLCPEGWCISNGWRCNGVKDCANGEDEQNCMCPDTHLACDAGGCFDKTRRCDGTPDCSDGSDEWNCVTVQNYTLVVRDSETDRLLPVCYQEFSGEDADTACRQMGFGKAEKFWDIDLEANTTSEIFVRAAPTSSFSTMGVDRMQFLVKKKPSGTCDTGKVVGMECQSYDCGRWPSAGAQPEVVDNRVRRMAGGRISGEHEWPSVAVLYYPQKKWACTASVLAPYWLITSAMCVRRTDFFPIDWKVIAGNAYPSVDDASKQTIRSVVRFVQHPSYKLRMSLLADYDVMLVQLNEPLPLESINSLSLPLSSPTPSPSIVSICLPSVPTPAGVRCVTAGWGYTTPGGYYINTKLKHMEMSVWPKDVCNSTAHYRAMLTDRSMCASNDRSDWEPCFNDEGSPLMCQFADSPNRWYLAGVLTSQSCGSSIKHPAIYADVFSMKNWILGVIGRSVGN